MITFMHQFSIGYQKIICTELSELLSISIQALLTSLFLLNHVSSLFISPKRREFQAASSFFLHVFSAFVVKRKKLCAGGHRLRFRF